MPFADVPLPQSIASRTILTGRLSIHLLESGPVEGDAVLFIHGHLASGRFFQSLLERLPDIHCLAPDLRGYGRSDAIPADARHGVLDYAQDLLSLLDALNLPAVHLVGWGEGALIAMRLAILAPERVQSILLEAPLSPFGLYGTRDAEGRATADDYAGTGAASLLAGALPERPTTDQLRAVFTEQLTRPGFSLPTPIQEILVAEIGNLARGSFFYPGNMTAVGTWPYFGPGTFGMLNCLSPKYCRLTTFAEIDPHPPVLWLRGLADPYISNHGAFDPAVLGAEGKGEGWPGQELYPPQPMLDQIRTVLNAYAANGGTYHEVVLPDCGHAPHLEAPEAFISHLRSLTGHILPVHTMPVEPLPVPVETVSSPTTVAVAGDTPGRRSFLSWLPWRRRG